LARGRGGHEFVRPREVELKGLPDPMPVVTVAWKPAAGEAESHLPRSLAGPFPPLHGRGDELGRLMAAWERVTAGATEAVLIAGEPGIGKTRLAAEFARRVHADGGIVLYGHCDEGLVVPYLPFIEALRQLVEASATPVLGDRPGELARLVPELVGTAGIAALAPVTDAETERYRLFDAVASWVAAVAEHRTALFVVDDLHWADRATLLLLRHILASAGVQGVLVLGTYRDTDVERNHPLGELLADLRRRELLDRISLGGLGWTEVCELVEAAAGHDLDADGMQVAELVWSGTDGNPFFAQQVLRHLAESGVLAQQNGRWRTTVSLDQIGIPEGVRDVVGRRLSRLSPSANALLAGAAVAGQSFVLDVLAPAADLAVDDAIDDLDDAVTAGLLREDGAGSYRFTHALLRSTLYEELTATRRARWHRRIAEATEGCGRRDPASLAHHWARAGTDRDAVDRALAALRTAADDALARVAPDEAASHLAAALALAADVGRDDEPWRLDTLIRLGEAQRQAGDPAHRQTLLDAGDLAAAVGDDSQLVRAVLANQRAIYASMLGVDVERLAALESALAVVGNSDLAVRSRLLTRVAVEQSYGLEIDDRLQLVTEAVELALAAGDRTALAVARFAESYTIRPLPVTNKVERWQEVVELTAELSDPAPLGFAQIYLAMTALDRGDHGLADEATAAAARLGQDSAHPTVRWRAAVWRAARLFVAGRPADALALAEQARDIGRAGGQLDAEALFLLQKSAAVADLGTVSREIGDAVRDVFGDNATTSGFGAFMISEAGRLDEAAEVLEAIHDAGWPLRRDPGWQPTLATAALAVGNVGDPRFARALLDVAAPYADAAVMSDVGPVCDLATCYGLLLLTAGDIEAAVTQLTHALSVTQRVRAPGWQARTRLILARALLRRGGPGDRTRADELLRLADAAASELKLAPISEQATALLLGVIRA